MPTTLRNQDPVRVETDALLVPIYAGARALAEPAARLDRALGGAIQARLAAGDLQGGPDEVLPLFPDGRLPAKRVLLLGLGAADDLDEARLRAAIGRGARRARELGARSLAVALPDGGPLTRERAAQAVAEGLGLALYRYAAERKAPSEEKEIDESALLAVSEEDMGPFQAGLRAGDAIAESVSLARDLVNGPPNVCTPTAMAEAAALMAAELGLRVEIGDRAWAAARDMGAFLAVAQGAGEDPRFIELEHDPGVDGAPTLVLIGKGVTFDTGGISIKPAEGMGRLKADMAGAAAVIGALRAAADLALPLRVIGLAPCAENMPDAEAYRPADVVRASDGTTIEIVSTDAEGRMLLADALVHARRFAPDAVVDLATLTGACVVALGRGVSAGLFANDEALRDAMMAASARSAERLWPLPLFDDYRRSLRSEVADLKNSGGRGSGVGSSAVFLQTFVDFPWAHVDMAGMATRSESGPSGPEGATGYGVRLLVELLRHWS